MVENTLGEWSDGDDDWIWEIDDDIIRNIDENVSSNWSDSESDDIIRNIDIQTGGGEKRKSDEVPEPEQDFYEIETTKKYNSKKFRMTATDYTIRFNNVLNDLDLLESHERVQKIFEHLLNDVTEDMNERD